MATAAKYFVYALIDPRDNTPFYIGKGSGRRPFDHERDARRGHGVNGLKVERIQAIHAAGRAVVIHFVSTELTELSAFREKVRLIGAIGPQLTNRCGALKSRRARLRLLARRVSAVRHPPGSPSSVMQAWILAGVEALSRETYPTRLATHG